MGGALLRGWAASALADGRAWDVAVHEPAPDPDLAKLIAGRGWRLNPPTAGPTCDVLVLAVKPQTFEAALAGGARDLIGSDTLIVSIMAGVSAARLEALCGTGRVMRAMPNTPGAIGKGVTGLFRGPGASAADAALACDLLAPLGAVEPLPTEAAMDALTAVSGSGPAYVFLLAEALAAAGEAEGLTPDLAARLARATLVGSAALLDAGDVRPEALRKAVTSPQGTTAAALDVLMAEGGLVDLMTRAVRAAAARSRELGG
jgi:pyrroline-5-carboxylate reductase